jgi:hypothetical protein
MDDCKQVGVKYDDSGSGVCEMGQDERFPQSL